MTEDVLKKVEQKAQQSKSVPSAAEVDAEIKMLELETKRLQFKHQQAQLQDLEETLAEREMRRETKRSRSKTNGETLVQLEANTAAAQKRCNHRKGGNGPGGIVGGNGDSSQYAIFKHTFENGDTCVFCLRCHKSWKPPVKSSFTGDNAKEDYLAAVAEYQAALNFTTNNTPSSSVAFKFSDGGELYRRNTANAKL